MLVDQNIEKTTPTSITKPSKLMQEILQCNQHNPTQNPILPNSLRDLIEQFRDSIIKGNKEQWSYIETALESKHSWQEKPPPPASAKRGPGKPPNKLPTLIPQHTLDNFIIKK